ncbi:MAG: hypothetical protein ACM3YE_11035, partial [Bacteroidota bacterium]
MLRKLVSGVLVGFDVISIVLSGYIGLFLRFEGKVADKYFEAWFHFLPVMILVGLAVYYLFGLYNRLWRYAGVNEILTICFAVSVSTIGSSLYMYMSKPGFPRSVYIIAWGFNVACVGSSR